MSQQEWTERDEDQLRTDRRREQEKTVRRVMEEAQKRLDKAEENYNCTGSASAARTVRKYEDLVMVCEMALDSMSRECGRCALHRRNGAGIVKQLRERRQLGEQMPIEEAITFVEAVAY